MTWFHTPERIARLHDEANAWLGTPFVPHAAIRGAGVDCVHLVAGILAGCGFPIDPRPANWPAYTMDGGDHLSRSQVIDWIEASGLWTLAAPPILPGDLLCLRVGLGVPHHVGLAIDVVRFVHVLRGTRTRVSRIDDPTYGRRLRHVYRPNP